MKMNPLFACNTLLDSQRSFFIFGNHQVPVDIGQHCNRPWRLAGVELCRVGLRLSNPA